MPLTFTIDPARRLITSTGHGVLTKDEMMAQIRALQAAPNFDRDYRQLWDLTETTEIAITFPDMMWIAEVNVFSLTTPRAFLAPANAIFGVARMFEMLRRAKGETGIRVFRDRAEAERWLERVPAATQPAEK
jgi:hypothetical protein